MNTDFRSAWMYIVECTDGSYYTGSTDDLEGRLWQHNETEFGAKHTRRRRPVKLVYSEEYGNIAEAYAREREVHGWSRAKKIALIERRFGDLPQLSRGGPSTSSGTGVQDGSP